MRRAAAFVLLFILVVTIAGPAGAFGTVSHGQMIHGQDRQHEKITRAALGCEMFKDKTCFETKSLGELAGDSWTFGAVGSPDNLFMNLGMVLTADAHCDTEDGIGRTPMTALLTCRTWMKDYINRAVVQAAAMLKPDGTIDDSQMPTIVPCVFNGNAGRAKCNVLESFGIVLHASQDFYSHTNWTDVPVATKNAPPGLNRTDRAPFIDLRLAASFPVDLISGCFKPPESVPFFCKGKTKHADLNKDKGPIDNGVGGTGTTERGKVSGNFARAVAAAISDTTDKWNYLKDQLKATYGEPKATLMICAITRDDPAVSCQAGEKQSRSFPFNLFVNIGIFVAAAGLFGGGLYLAAGRRRRFA